MSTIAMWQLIIGALVPPLIAVAQRPKFPGWLRVSVMLVVAVVASLVTLAVQSDLDWHNWSRTVGLVIVGAIAAYHGIWQPSGIAPAIEAATTPATTKTTPAVQ